MKAYLDIETSFGGEITVVGIFCPPGRMIQLIGDEVNRTNLWKALEGVASIVTYNGNRFDLPKIRDCMGLDLFKYFDCQDLLYACHRKKLYGGLKKVEENLGIGRNTRGIDGMEAMRLWEQYRRFADDQSLRILLEYNREDTVNLYHLERRLSQME
jgi:uncharacterized protein YprB with RNaseH-like and TPR domain